MIKKIAHVAISTSDLEKEVSFYKSLGFSEVRRFEESDPKLKAVFMDKDGMSMEIFEFENPDEEKSKIIKNHTAFVTDNMEEDLKHFEENGYEVSIPLRDGVTVKKYVFLKNDADSVVELIEI